MTHHKKRLAGWVVHWSDDTTTVLLGRKDAAATVEKLERLYSGRIVRMVEHNPREAAVVRAAKLALELLQKPKHPHARAESALAVLYGPVSRLIESEKRKGKL